MDRAGNHDMLSFDIQISVAALEAAGSAVLHGFLQALTQGFSHVSSPTFRCGFGVAGI